MLWVQSGQVRSTRTTNENILLISHRKMEMDHSDIVWNVHQMKITPGHSGTTRWVPKNKVDESTTVIRPQTAIFMLLLFSQDAKNGSWCTVFYRFCRFLLTLSFFFCFLLIGAQTILCTSTQQIFGKSCDITCLTLVKSTACPAYWTKCWLKQREN